jgi:hypothetical protein
VYSKHLISVPVLILSFACSSEPAGDDDTSVGGSTSTGATGGRMGAGGAHAGTTSSGGSAGVTGGTGALGGTGGSGLTGAGGSAGTLATGGTGGGAGTATGTGGLGTGGTGFTGGTAGMGGSAGTAPSGGGPGGGMGGTGVGGSSGGGAGMGAAGMVNTGGSGPMATFKCANLSLAPAMTGVAKPAGAAGGLKVLDWAGFKGAASFTFDDNTPSQIPNYNALKGTGGHFTWFVVGSWLNGQSSSISSYKGTIADGQELANHTYSHSSTGSQSDLQQNESFITTNFGVNANTMAAPNCADAWSSVAPSVMFQNRGPCGKGIATVSPRDSTSPFKLPAYLPDANESASSMSSSITAGKWRIFVIHGFDSQGGTYQPVPIANVTGSMSKAVMDGYWVEGISNVGAYWQGQKLIPESATTTATWTLPAKFPTNMCVRVTTSGGTVTQKGQTIPWNDHGYYEISLDAGEVTVK